MQVAVADRRKNQRFDVHLSLRYRVSQKGAEGRWHTGITRDISKEGLAFKPRKPLPAGSHVELHIDWPVLHQSVYPVDLQATGFVMRSDANRTVVTLSSHRFLIQSATLSKTA